jgi:hypothetical protein
VGRADGLGVGGAGELEPPPQPATRATNPVSVRATVMAEGRPVASLILNAPCLTYV